MTVVDSTRGRHARPATSVDALDAPTVRIAVPRYSAAKAAEPVARPTYAAPAAPLPPQAAGHAAPVAPKRRRRWPWIVLGFFAVFGLIGALNQPTTPAPAAQVAAPAPAPVAAPSPAPAPPVAPRAAPAPGRPPAAVPAARPALSMASQIVAWRDGGGREHLNALTADFSATGTVASGGDPAALNTTCHTLQDDVASAQAYAPIPDGQAQAEWAAALASTSDSARDCIAGTDQTDTALISQAADEITTAASHLKAAGHRIAVINGN